MTSTNASHERPGAAAPPIDWPQVLAAHDRWMRTVVRARTGRDDAVDDVMQEVSLAVIKQRAPPVDCTKIAPWLYRVAVLQSLLYRRRRGRWHSLTDRYAQRRQPTEEDSRSTSGLDWLLADERRRTVRTALERLPPRDAEILLLKYGEDWDYHQIAAHLGIGHSAAEARLHRARGRLRHELTALNLTEVAS